jgi:hypothetical protein
MNRAGESRSTFYLTLAMRVKTVWLTGTDEGKLPPQPETELTSPGTVVNGAGIESNRYDSKADGSCWYTNSRTARGWSYFFPKGVTECGKQVSDCYQSYSDF